MVALGSQRVGKAVIYSFAIVILDASVWVVVSETFPRGQALGSHWWRGMEAHQAEGGSAEQRFASFCQAVRSARSLL